MMAAAAMFWTVWMAAAGDPSTTAPSTARAGGATVRFATFNIQELNAVKLGQVDSAGRGANPQLRKAAEIVQRVRPDVLLINEIDYDGPRQRNAALFRDRYLRIGQNDQAPLDYPYIFFAPVNTGVPTGRDLDHDGKTNGPADAFGFGRYPGEYGMALYSRFPIDVSSARTFQKLLWKDVPGHMMPDGRDDRPTFYLPEQAAILRLSSKSHWDAPVRIGRTIVHVLASHPTPPVFDGPEDRNGRRNHDEIRFWADYLTGGTAAGYIVDDQSRRGGLPADALFIVMGDLNSDPVKMDPQTAYRFPCIQQLLRHSRVQDLKPTSPGGTTVAGDQATSTNGSGGGHPARLTPSAERATWTSNFGRVDYVLPCRELTVHAAGVFWPAADDALHALVGPPDPASDHRLVWVDIARP
ncbi:MAG: endonuclease/exonuclease/phosphatase family protein [Planctomycetes bacterium]|nr:endonuclease/exonuclease/phosphatase family protein [Planctomycetota bacterium]